MWAELACRMMMNLDETVQDLCPLFATPLRGHRMHGQIRPVGPTETMPPFRVCLCRSVSVVPFVTTGGSGPPEDADSEDEANLASDPPGG